MEVGEIWAYRRSAKDPLAEVRVLRIGIKKPLRVKVRFEDYEAEEVEQWVPPARLRVPWTDREGFVAKERRWNEVEMANPLPAASEIDAASWILGDLGESELRDYCCGSTRTVSIISHAETLADKAGMTVEDLMDSANSFWEEGKLVVPWSATIALAEGLAKAHPDAVFRVIATQEREMAESDIRWKSLNPHGHWNRQQEEHREVDLRSIELRRKWVGDDLQTGYRNLNHALLEVERLRGLVEWAVKRLDHYGHKPSSETLARNLKASIEAITLSDP